MRSEPRAARRSPAGRLRLALLLLPAALAASPGCARQEAPRARHLLLVTVDTLRADRLGCYGGPNRPSPAIDALAAEGVRFERAFVSRAMTLPSMTSFFTSRYLDEHGVLDNRMIVGEGEVLLAEHLAAAGFRTRAWNASRILAPQRSHIEQGFAPESYQHVADETRLTELAGAFLRSEFGREGRREFVWVHYMRPHKPYKPPPPFDRRFVDPAYRGRHDGSSANLDRIYLEREPLAPEDRRHIESIYDGTIAYVDSLVKELLAALEASGQARDTLVVFAADHGEDLYSHNFYYYHANSVYRSSTQVPLLFRQPGAVRGGAAVPDLAESVDLLPTLLRWLAVAPLAGAEGWRGRDLSALLREDAGPAPPPRELSVAQWGNQIYAIRGRHWLFVHNPGRVAPDGPPVAGRYPIAEQELYDLDADPDEQVNVIAAHPEQAQELRAALERWQGGLARGKAAVAESDERNAELEALGYIDDSWRRDEAKERAP
jgi:arylsulfatase A-like enzyme